MANYKNGKIYKIESDVSNKIYIGSTTQPTVAHRLASHVRNNKSHKKRIKHGGCSSYSILDEGSYTCTLIEMVPCECKDELSAREAYFIKQYRNDDAYECVNIITPLRSPIEYAREHKKERKIYYDENKERLLSHKREYYRDNNEAIRAKNKKYADANRERLNEYGRQYWAKNKETNREKQRLYRIANAEKIKLREARKITCECGQIVNAKGLKRHIETKKHIQLTQIS